MQHEMQHKVAKALRYYNSQPEEAILFAKELSFLSQHSHDYPMIPYDFTSEYSASKIETFFDDQSGMYYVLHNQKRLYFPEGMERKFISKSYINLLIEQHRESPHRYLTARESEASYNTFVDVGAAEAILSLELIDTIDRIFIFEGDARWIPALKATFEPWREKVTIIDKMVGNPNTQVDTEADYTVTLDSFQKEFVGNVLIKIDVEGHEEEVLMGAESLFERDDVDVLCCTYHKANDADNFNSFFSARGYNTEFSDGYMLMIGYDDNLPYFRKGVLRAWKTEGAKL
jgi:uncharacterized LabA/DUF88 family protein